MMSDKSLPCPGASDPYIQTVSQRFVPGPEEFDLADDDYNDDELDGLDDDNDGQDMDEIDQDWIAFNLEELQGMGILDGGASKSAAGASPSSWHTANG